MPDVATAALERTLVRVRRPRYWPAVAGALLVLAAPPVYHLLSADLVTLAVLWVATALQLRSRASVVDRLILAAGLLMGWFCLLGVVASWWPWGLAPVALGEATALPLAAWLLWWAPRRAGAGVVRPVADALLLAVYAGTTWFCLRPLLGRDFTGRLAELYHGEDLARHFALYDTVRSAGGYLVFHRALADVTLQDGFQTYPQGSHLVLAVVNEFARNGYPPPDSTASLSTFLLLAAGVLAVFVAAVLWAVRWAAGPALGQWAVLPLCVPVALYLLLAEGTPLLLAGFESELFGLALFALLVALVLRPLGRPGEQLLLLSALTIGIAFSYYLLLATAGPLLVLWAVVHRRRLRRVRAAATAVGTGAVALLPVLVNWKQAGSVTVLTMPGGVFNVSLHLLLPLLALTGLVLLTRAARRNPVRRAALGAILTVGGVTLALLGYQLTSTGKTSYYYEKLLHQVVVVTLIALGAAVVPAIGPAGRRGWPVQAGWSVVTAALLAGALLLNVQTDNANGVGWRHTLGTAYQNGTRAAPVSAALVTAVNASRPVPDQRIAMLQVEPHAGEDPRFAEGNLWLGVLAHDNGHSWQAWIWSRWRRSPQEIVDYANASPVPMRVYLSDPDTAAEIQRLAGPGDWLDVALVRYDDQDHPVVLDPYSP